MSRKRTTGRQQAGAVVQVRETVRARVPRVPFVDIARRILGSRYELSLVICGDALARRVNCSYRRKTYAANVLSFSLATREGEIFLNVRAAEREAKRHGVSTNERLVLLFTHGCLHLAGYEHGSDMERKEKEILRRYAR